MNDFELDVVHLARLGVQGDVRSASALARRLMRNVLLRRPDLAESVQAVLNLSVPSPARGGPIMPLPVDLDSRLALVRRDTIPSVPVEPTWSPSVARELDAVIEERRHLSELASEGIAPSRSLLFTGPPGVGKTLAARWLALRLDRPLLTLDLAAVMSSFLGRTGNNIRVVLDYARKESAVLLLDEFDAIAKRRDDATEVGELKRLVTVLLQAVDDWPETGILIAATNHPELLDPAVWRRFDRTVSFPHPTVDEIGRIIAALVTHDAITPERLHLLSALLEGSSHDEIVRAIVTARRSAIVRHQPFSETLGDLVDGIVQDGDQATKLRVAAALTRDGKSQREVSAVTGLSRDTIRKHLGSKPPQTRKRVRK